MRGSGRLIAGLLIVLVGLVLLSGNLGFSRPGLLRMALRFWPVFLIVLGVALLTGRRGRWLVVASLAGFILLLAVGGVWSSWGAGQLVRSTFAPSSATPQLSLLEVQVEMADGQVSTAQPSDRLYSLTVNHRPGGASCSFNTSGDTGLLQLNTSRGVPVFGSFAGPTTVMMAFDDQTPVDLDVRVAAGEVDLDLRRYQLRQLTINCGAGQVNVHLPKPEGELNASITVRAGETGIWVPAGSPVRVRAGVTLGQRDFQAAGLVQVGSYWQDEAYATAGSRIDLDLRTTVGKLRIARY